VFFDMATCTCEYFDPVTQEPKSKAKVRSLPCHSVCARCCALTVGRVAQGGVPACLIVKANTTKWDGKPSVICRLLGINDHVRCLPW
jgi:hypothetical protein